MLLLLLLKFDLPSRGGDALRHLSQHTVLQLVTLHFLMLVHLRIGHLWRLRYLPHFLRVSALRLHIDVALIFEGAAATATRIE